MNYLDYLVLFAYFALMMWMGWKAMKTVKGQEDYFMGGRSFGKVLQGFAAFGAGTGAADPVNTARTSFTNGMSGMWSVMSWLFVTPFYWITGVWYRRLRTMTLGDFYVERYESKALGAAYTIFGLLFYMVYTSMMFSAIGKVAAPLIGDTFTWGGSNVPMEYVLVPIIALIVMVYGILGGVTAAYWTDMLQGIFIIFLSIILIPFGLQALVAQYGDPSTEGLWAGFRIIHEQLPATMFQITGSTNSSEFPVHRIVAVSIILLVGIVVQPHFIATGGGTAKSEFDARVGLVAGNVAKRFCTIGWALTALILLTLYSDNLELMADPDKAWGIASRELLWPGLRGLMLACLLAALMSSVDCYMIVSSALVVRNFYAPYINANGTDQEYLKVGRIAGGIIVVGAVIFSWSMMDVFGQLQLTWLVPMLFAAPFWVGMWWRRATTQAAWMTLTFSALFFFILPWIIPMVHPEIKSSPFFTRTNQIVITEIERETTPLDIRKREVEQRIWDQKRSTIEASGSSLTASTDSNAMDSLGPRPDALMIGDPVIDIRRSGGNPIYWTGGVVVSDETQLITLSETQNGNVKTKIQNYEGPLTATGNFRLDFLIYAMFGMNLSQRTDAWLASLELPPKIFLPFLVMIVASILTGRNGKEALDRFYSKMKTPVVPDPSQDRAALKHSMENIQELESKKLFPNTDLEMSKPTKTDVIGFLISFAICFGVVLTAILVARIGA